MGVMKMIHNKQIGFVGLLETKVKACKLGALYLKMFRGWCLSHNLAHHYNGRILIAWNPLSFEVDIKGSSSQFMHCELKPKGGDWFALSVVYVVNDSKGREHLLKDLVHLAVEMHLPWIVGGDFNAVLSAEDRLDYRGNTKEMVPFQQCVADCDLEDIKFNGSFFTWNNKQEGKDRVYAKLDRFLANRQWRDKYSTAEVTFLPEGEFDHSPGLLTIYPNMQNIKKPFRYFNFWKYLKGFTDLVKKAWLVKIDGTPMFCLVSRLKYLKTGLKELNRQGRGNKEVQDHDSYQNMIKIQQSLQQQPGNVQLIEEESKAQRLYNEAHRNYLTYLSQKAKIDWLKSGDENTKMFHSSLKKRRQQNTIYSIQDQFGRWIDNQEGVVAAFQDFYKSLLGISIPNRTRVHKRLVQEGPLVSQSQADWLV
ncbi:uncharacterized protein LOC133824305 [Humulus lupulus]|uniref:uncharacterized protein LOC133824305 n=1 Tax=Humulus lupulus TaxID=3486 RepID=UPI002B4167A9|nr:uncharacterized protein LOC133824305 [Humulus lupulus]